MFRSTSIILLLTLSVLFGNLKGQSIAGFTSGEAAFCDSVNSGFISLNAYSGLILNWEYSTNDGQTWNLILNPTSTQSYNNLKVTTSFRAIVQKTGFAPDTSTICKIKVQVKGATGKTHGGGIFCHESGPTSVYLSGYDGEIVHWESSTDNGQLWNPLSTTNYTLPIPNVTKNTLFRAVVRTQSVCPNDTSAQIQFKIDIKSNAGTIIGTDSVCINTPGDTLFVQQTTGKIKNWMHSEDLGLTWNVIGDTNSYLVYPQLTKTNMFKCVAQNGICSADTSENAIMAVFESFPAFAGNDITITRFDPLILSGSGNGSPKWSPELPLSDPNAFSTNATPLNTTTFVLEVNDSHSCKSSDTLVVTVIVPIPTGISPNSDGTNDLFVIDKVEDYPNCSLTVYNRWGKIMYKASPYQNNWSGTNQDNEPLPDDSYFYVFDFGNGNPSVTNYLLIKR